MNTSQRAVRVAGAGVVCRMGNTLDEVWENILAGKEGSMQTPDLSGHGMACTAAMQAWESASGNGLRVAPERVGLIAATSRGVTPALPSAGSPRMRGVSGLVHSSGGALAGEIARAVGHRGPAMMLSANCVSSAVAVCTAADLISAGVWDAALVGGVELASRPNVQETFRNAGVPLVDESNETGNLGVRLADGAGFVVLSTDIGNPELAGWSHRIEPTDRCGIHGMSTAALALDAALVKAGFLLSDLMFLHGHGNGNPRSDDAERKWLSQQTGLHMARAFSWKQWAGHCLGASPVIELALTCHAMGNPDGVSLNKGGFHSPWAWYGFGLWGYAAAWVVR